MKKTLNIEGLDCAACAVELEEELQKTAGVLSASVSFVMQKIVLECEDEAALERAKDVANHFEEVHVLEEVEAKVPSDSSGKNVVKIEGLHCAGCAAELEKILSKIDGVSSVSVDFVGQKISFDAENRGAYAKLVKATNRFEKVRVLSEEESGVLRAQKRGVFSEHKREILKIVVSCLFFLGGILLDKFVDGGAARICCYICYAVAYFSVGFSVLVSTAKNVAKGRVFDENFLMTVASIGAAALGDFAEGVAVMLLYQIGEWLQAVAVGSSRRSVSDLMALKSDSANLVKSVEKDGMITEEILSVAPETLQIGDVLTVRAGEKIPCDGVLIASAATLDAKSLTGEAEYRTLKEGDEVLSGCINAGEVFRMRVTKEYKDSAVQRILDLMENSTVQKAQSEKFITKFSRYYTPIVCIAALFVAFCFPLFNVFRGGAYSETFAYWTKAALNFLVISCPCALIISVPLTYFCALGAAAKHGVLIKGSTYLDALASVKTVAFDKTGTLTEGNFSVVKTAAIAPFKEECVLRFAAAAEKNSTHPIARAFDFVKCDDLATQSAEEFAGNGIKAVLYDGERRYTVLCGKREFLLENGVDAPETESANTVIYVAVDEKACGYAEIGDVVRASAKDVVEELRKAGVQKAVMLTGDSEKRARIVAEEVGLDGWKAGLLPDEKLAVANELKREGGLLYVGDGLNDAPVMATADCAVSMGKLGAAAAVEASDLVLVSDNLSALVAGRKLAKRAQKIVKENIAFSISCKIAFLACSLAGIVPLWLAVFADVGVMMLAVLNSLRTSK